MVNLTPHTIVTYLDPTHGAFAQYDRAMAGHYRNRSRRDRRAAELAAHAAGVGQGPVMHGWFVGVANGAPGLLGGAPTPSLLAARRAAAYPTVGKLP